MVNRTTPPVHCITIKRGNTAKGGNTSNGGNTSKGGKHPVARRNERARSRAKEAPAAAARREGRRQPPRSSHSDRAKLIGLIGTPHGVLRGCAPLTPRYETPPTSKACNPVAQRNGQASHPVARRNERARATSERGTREGRRQPPRSSHSDQANLTGLTGTPHGVLRGCAPLTPRYEHRQPRKRATPLHNVIVKRATTP